MTLTKLIALVVGKKRFDSLFAEIGETERSGTRTNRNVRQLKPRLTVAKSTVVPVTSLEVAHQVLSSGFIIGVVAEGLHEIRRPTPAVVDPTGIIGELSEVPDQRLCQVRNTAVGANDVALGDQDVFVVFAKVVPPLGVTNCGIGNLKVLGEIFLFKISPFWLESLASRFLIVPIPSNVGPLVAHAEGSVPEFSVGNADFIGGQIGSGGRGIRHDDRLGFSFAVYNISSIQIDQREEIKETKRIHLPKKFGHCCCLLWNSII